MALGQHCIFVLFRFSMWSVERRKCGGEGVVKKKARSRCAAQLFLHLELSALSDFTQSPFHLSLHKNLTFLYDSFFLPFLPPGCVVDCLTPLGE